MLLNSIRVFFLLLVAAMAMKVAEYVYQVLPAMAILAVAVGVACLLIALDVWIPRKSLLAISGVFFGLLVGMLVAYGVNLVLKLFIDTYRFTLMDYLVLNDEEFAEVVNSVRILVGVICCYLAVSFILQTKDDVRFVIPYVEFVKERKGQHPLILDTSVIIDGRIADIFSTWTIDSTILIPRFVLQELQTVADSGDKMKRNRGRRGLDVVNRLQNIPGLEVQFQAPHLTSEEAAEPVDQRLVTLARKINGRIVTNDYNLNKVAQIRGVEVININDLANALKPVFLPGEGMAVKIIKPGEEPGQGVGYLDDGTMVVVEGAREKIGQTVPVVVTSVLQTSAGRMVFARMEGTSVADRSRRRPQASP